MMREVVTAFAVGQPGGAQATGMLEQQGGGVARRRGAVAAVPIGPVLLLAALGCRPVAIRERAKVLRIHAAIVLGHPSGRQLTPTVPV